MSEYVIKGGIPLCGTVEVQGSKNSAVAILMACIVVKGKVTLRRVPYISDVVRCIEILRYLGAVVEWHPDRTLSVDCSELEYVSISESLVGSIRASTYLMGACLNRFGRCHFLQGGGCSLGRRPVDLHVGALGAIGAELMMDGAMYMRNSPNGSFRFPAVTVGGTINAVVAAACGNGRCLFENCAREPHVCDVVRFLNSCGADIRGMGSSVLEVRGVDSLKGCDFVLSGDMIEGGTYLLAGVATRGVVTVKSVNPRELGALCGVLDEAGVDVWIDGEAIGVSGEVKRGLRVETGEYPLFPTDLHPQTVALMGSVPYNSVLCERVFGCDRFGYLEQLGKQGLDYVIEGDRVSVFGGGYTSASVCATDLRGGAANVIAALCADGESTVRRAEFIERGYSDMVLKLRALGAVMGYGGL